MQGQAQDYYQRLGLDRNASAVDIKKSYRRLARTHHPDISKAADATQQMAELNQAHAVLSNPEKRAIYDAEGHKSPAFTNGKPETADPNDFFDSFFRRSEASVRTAKERSPIRGHDQYATITLTLAQVYTGVKQMLTLNAVIPHTVEVTIPAGVFAGQHIRLAGHGDTGARGGVAGDLLLQVAIEPDTQWHAEGRDVYGTLLLAPWEAALGAWVIANTPIDTAEVHVPPASTTGRILRLKGRGIPSEVTPGDLYLAVKVVWPPAKDHMSLAAYTAFQAAFPNFSPRNLNTN